MTNKRLDRIIELSKENNISFLDVMEIYTRFNSKVYCRATKKEDIFQLYNPELEEQTLKLTERYFRRFNK